MTNQTNDAKREVVVLSAVRTAIGKYGGGLKDVPPADLAATCVREAVSRAGIEPAEVGSHALAGGHAGIVLTCNRIGKSHLPAQQPADPGSFRARAGFTFVRIFKSRPSEYIVAEARRKPRI